MNDMSKKAHKWQNVLTWCVNSSIWTTKCLLWFQAIGHLSLNMVMLNINLYTTRSLFQNINHPCKKHLHSLTLFSTHSSQFKQICCVKKNHTKFKKYLWTIESKVIDSITTMYLQDANKSMNNRSNKTLDMQ